MKNTRIEKLGLLKKRHTLCPSSHSYYPKTTSHNLNPNDPALHTYQTTLQTTLKMDLWLLSINPLTPLPSFHELYLCDAVSKTFHDALTRYVGIGVNYVGGRRVYGEMLGRFLVGAAEVRSAATNGGSLAEAMYGCTKSSLITTPDGSRVMSDVSKPARISLAVAEWALWVLGVVAKKRFEEMSRSNPSPPPTAADVASLPESLADLKRLFRFLYPYLIQTTSGLSFAYKWAYLYGFTPHFTPLLHLASQTVRRLTMRDVRARQVRGGGGGGGGKGAERARVIIQVRVCEYRSDVRGFWRFARCCRCHSCQLRQLLRKVLISLFAISRFARRRG